MVVVDADVMIEVLRKNLAVTSNLRNAFLPPYC